MVADLRGVVVRGLTPTDPLSYYVSTLNADAESDH